MRRLLIIISFLSSVFPPLLSQEVNEEIQRMLSLAQEGDVNAQFDLACYYEETKDYDKAFDWFLEAAIQGDADAQYKVGYYYWCRLKDNPIKAFDWWELAAKNYQAEAMFYLGCCYFWGINTISIGDNDDTEKIFGDMYQSVFAIYIINAIRSSEINNKTKAIDLWINAAKKGISPAQYFLSMLYFRGGYTYITTKTQALEWLNSSAEQGCIFAIYELGCYHLSTGEKEKAISYFIQVANADYPGNFYDQLLPAYYAQKKLIKLYSDNIQERKYWKKKNQELETLLETF